VILVFDLDDTLYDERSFVESGFAAVAAFLAPRIGRDTGDLRSRMVQLLDSDGRGRVFDQLLSESGVEDADLVAACVAEYRGHKPAINLAPGVRHMLEGLTDYRKYLVTDGDADVQARKIAALRLAPYFIETYRTWVYGIESAKPSLHTFELIRARESCEWAEIVYVADDPSKDFVSLRAAGAATVRVHSGRFAHATAAPGYDADLHVSRVTEVPALLGL